MWRVKWLPCNAHFTGHFWDLCWALWRYQQDHHNWHLAANVSVLAISCDIHVVSRNLLTDSRFEITLSHSNFKLHSMNSASQKWMQCEWGICMFGYFGALFAGSDLSEILYGRSDLTSLKLVMGNEKGKSKVTDLWFAFSVAHDQLEKQPVKHGLTSQAKQLLKVWPGPSPGPGADLGLVTCAFDLNQIWLVDASLLGPRSQVCVWKNPRSTECLCWNLLRQLWGNHYHGATVSGRRWMMPKGGAL